MSQHAEKIQNILREVNHSSTAKIIIKNDDNLFEMGVLDSLSMVQFIVAIENSFKFKISNREIDYDTFTTINGIEKFIISKLGK